MGELLGQRYVNFGFLVVIEGRAGHTSKELISEAVEVVRELRSGEVPGPDAGRQQNI